MWNNVAIRFHVPSLHKCDFCVKHKKLYQGHHVDWCLLAAKQKTVDENAISNNATSADTNIQLENKYTTLTHDTVELQNTPCITVEQNNELVSDQSAVATTMPLTPAKEIERTTIEHKDKDSSQDANALDKNSSVNTKQFVENKYYPLSENSDSSSDESLCTDLQIADLSDEKKSSKLLLWSNIDHPNSEYPFQLVRQKRHFKTSNDSPKALSEIDEKRQKVNKPG